MGTQPGYIVTNTLSSQISEVLADISAIFIINLGLRRSFSITYLLSGVGSIALFIANKNDAQEFVTALIFVTKFGIAAAFAIAFIAYVRLFPTVLASTVFGIGNVISRTVTALAPVAAAVDIQEALVLNTVCTVIAAAVSLLLVINQPKFE